MIDAVTSGHYGVPPEELLLRLVGGLDAEASLLGGSNDVNFLDREALARDGKSLKSFNTILDLAVAVAD